MRLARDRETGVIYLYSEYYKGKAEPLIHAEGIRSRGEWIPGVIDPAAAGRSQKDGTQLLQIYQDMGLKLEPAVNAVEAGIYDTWQLLSAEILRVFDVCQHWLEEFRLYRRDEDGKIVKENDHLMDATRYLIISGRDLMRTKPVVKVGRKPAWRAGGTWMSR